MTKDIVFEPVDGAINDRGPVTNRLASAELVRLARHLHDLNKPREAYMIRTDPSIKRQASVQKIE